MTDDHSDHETWQRFRSRLAMIERHRPITPRYPDGWQRTARTRASGVGRVRLTANYSSALTTVGAGLVILVAVLGLTKLVGPTLGPGAISPSATQSPSLTGISGKVIIAGGPRPVAGQTGTRPVTVNVFTQTGDQVATRETYDNEIVTIELAPGRYTVASSYGNAGCTSDTVEVASGTTTTFTILCQIR